MDASHEAIQRLREIQTNYDRYYPGHSTIPVPPADLVKLLDALDAARQEVDEMRDIIRRWEPQTMTGFTISSNTANITAERGRVEAPRTDGGEDASPATTGAGEGA